MAFKKGNKPWNKGKNHSEETKKKISDNSKNNPNYGMSGKTHSNENKKKFSDLLKKRILIEGHPKGMLGKKHSEETKKKISCFMGGNSFSKGCKPWNKGKTGYNTSRKGKKHSEETKSLISIKSKKRFSSKEERNKTSQGLKKYYKKHPEAIVRLKEMRKDLVFPLKDSSIELKIQYFLTTLKIEFVTHKYMNLKNSYQCDIFIPIQEGIMKETIIEADGEFFHMNPEKYSAGDRIFKNGITAKQRWELDDSRTKELLEKGYNVIRLWENEIKIMTLDDFKNKLDEVLI